MDHSIEEAKSLREQQQNYSCAYLSGFNKSFLLWWDCLEQLYKYLSLLMPAMTQNIVPLRCKHLRLPAIFWWSLAKRNYAYS